MPHERPRQQPLTGPGRRALGRAHGRAPRRGLAMALVGVLAALQPSQIATAQYGQPRISVAPMITAAPASQVLLPIEVGPPEALPSNSFVRVRGLPPTVSLSDGHAIGPGSWAIPLFALATLKATIPAGIAERGNVVISLVAVDGTLLAEARTVLVIGSAAEKLFAESAQKKVPALAPPPPAPAPAAKAPARALTPEDKARAERLLARGEEHLSGGNVAAARDFFERAADAGLATAAIRLAATYDPVELRRAHAQGIVADAAIARRWYERARELGAPEAVERLARLGGN
jgi:hypothetical protein